MKNGDFNIRQMQVYSAVCLWKFCENIALKDRSILELIEHLVGISTCHSLPDWEQRGAMLSLTGRGDPIPSEIMSKIDRVYLNDFDEIHQSCVEVGIVDMYGGPTGWPKKFMAECVDILKTHCIDVPPLNFLCLIGHGDDSWGDPITDLELAQILNNYGVKFR